MLKNSVRVSALGFGLSLGLVFGCSHRASAPSDRIPASAESQYFKVTSHYTAIRDLTPQPDPAVTSITRVFQYSPNLKIAQISVRNPGNLYCQRGIPAQAPNQSPGPTLVKDTYVFTPPNDDSVYCYAWGQMRTAVDVDYLVSKSVVNLAEVPLDETPKLLAAIKELEAGRLSPDSRAVLENANLVSKERLVLTLPAQKDLASITLSLGDVIDFRTLEGKVATSAKTLSSAAIGPDGRPIGGSQNAKAPPPIKANPALLEPNSRLRQVYCAVTPEGGKPEVLYRGGDPAVGYADKAGKLICGINAAKKGAEKLAGQFELTVHYIKKDVALAELSKQAKSKEEARAAVERKANAEAVQIVAGVTSEWSEFNKRIVSRFETNLLRQQAQVKNEVENGPELKARRAFDLEKTDRLFPAQLSGDFARGNFTFSLVSRPSIASNGKTYVSYLITDGHTYLDSKSDGMPGMFVPEQPFRPIFEIMTKDEWINTGNATGVPQKFVVCAKNLDEVSRVMHELAYPAGGRVVPGYHEVFEKLAKVTVTDSKDCSTWFGSKLFSSPDVERLTFSRQTAFRFCYNREPRTKLDATDPTQYVAYVPNRIEALYYAPNGAVLKKQINRDHPFFDNFSVSATPWDSPGSASLEKERCFPTNTAFPELQSNGLMPGF